MLSKSPRRGTDPLAKILEPPPNESLAERQARLLDEANAKRLSDSIDEELQKQWMVEKKGPTTIKVLLLGQSESGKSTTLKNFQLIYEPKAFKAERASWRAIIQLNMVRSIHLILGAMTHAQASAQSPSFEDSSDDLPELNPELWMIKMRLSQLLKVEYMLTRMLTPLDSGESEPTPLVERSKSAIRELAVNSTAQWKSKFSRLLRSEFDGDSSDSEQGIDWDDPNDPGFLLHSCSADMAKLWGDPTIHQLLEKQNIRLEEMAGFFLDSLDRVTSPRYVPTNDDILRARLKTLGVSEHRFTIAHGSGPSRVWRVFDVGGHRSLRAAWAPYFDDMDAIIFLAPISCFDQVLAEDHKVNRLEDSVNLWTSIVSNELLKRTTLILFLNKIDILKAKLASGIKLADYVVSYGNRPNEFEHVAGYLRKKFGAILKEKSPISRTFYCHLTAVTDTHSTKYIISNIKDLLMRRNLADVALLQ